MTNITKYNIAEQLKSMQEHVFLFHTKICIFSDGITGTNRYWVIHVNAGTGWNLKKEANQHKKILKPSLKDSYTNKKAGYGVFYGKLETVTGAQLLEILKNKSSWYSISVVTV